MRSWISNLFTAISLLVLAFSSHGQAEEVVSVQYEVLKNNLSNSYQIPIVARKAFDAAHTNIQMLVLVGGHLTSIISAYKESFDNDPYLKKMIQILDEKNPWKEDRYYNDNAASIYFQYTSSGRFQVYGVDPDRVAYNDDHNIYFNIRKISNSTHWSIAECVQILLHEFLHFDKETPLQNKDALIAKISQFVKDHSQEIQLSGAEALHTLILPQNSPPPEKIHAEEYTNDQTWLAQKKFIQSRFLILQKNPQRTQTADIIYDNFNTFRNIIGRSLKGLHPFPAQIIDWPVIQVTSVRKNSQGNIQVSFRQDSQLYVYVNYNRAFQKINYGEFPINPVIPSSYFKMTLDPLMSSIDIERAFSSPQLTSDFEVYRIVEKAQQKFLSLKLKLENARNILNNSGSLFLVGKDTQNSQLFSLEVKKTRILSPDEVLLHFSLPPQNFEISQIIIPQADKSGYWEKVIRPSQPLTILGKNEISPPDLKIKHLAAIARDNEESKAKLELAVESKKAVTGVTVNVDHQLMAFSVSLNNIPLPQERTHNETYLSQGRKYYFPAKSFKKQKDQWLLEFPDFNFSQTRLGPKITEKLSWFFTRTYRNPYYTIVDLQDRKIRELWIHFSDGSIEKVIPEKELLFSTKPSPHKNASTTEAPLCHMLFL